MHEKLIFHHSFSEVSDFTTTTSSHVKPLGASSYWKPVALTKNPTVVAAFSALGALVTDELHRDCETVNPSVATHTRAVAHPDCAL